MDSPLQRIDHIMWDAESSNSLTTIAGILVFKKKLNKQKLIDVIEKRLLKYERFQKKVVIKNGNPMWHFDEDFQLQSHIHHIALPNNGSYKDLQECLTDLISQPLNYNKPLWDAHIIDNYEGGCVLLWRLHHAMADGMALVKVIFSLTGASARESLSANFPMPEVSSISKTSELDGLKELGLSLYEEAKHLLLNPLSLGTTLLQNWETMKEIRELFIGKKISHTIYKGKLGAIKKAAWSEALPLDIIKQIGKFHKATINDILVAMVAGALRKHLLLHHISVKHGMKVVLPMNIRKSKEIKSIHNEFSLISFDLPIHLKSFKERIEFVREKTSILKLSAEPLFLSEMLHLLADYTPALAKEKFLEIIGQHIGGVVTNVPGPSHAIYLAGEKVEDIHFWVSHTTTLGVGISLMSYNGKVYMGIVTDTGLVKDPDVITKAFVNEFRQMERSLVRKANKA